MPKMFRAGIRLRLLTYAAGVGLPLAFVGLVGVQAMWDATRHQLKESIRKQAEIVAVAFEQWMEAQREPLTTLSAYFDERPDVSPDFHKLLRLSVKTRPHWLGLHVLGPSGESLVSEPRSAPPLPSDAVNRLLSQMRDKAWAIDSDWSRGEDGGIILLAVPTHRGGAMVAQLDAIAMSGFFLKEVPLASQSVLSILGPQKRIILFRNPTPETYLGQDMGDSPFFPALGDQTTAIVDVNGPIDGVWRVYGLARTASTGCVVVVGKGRDVLYAPARLELNRYVILSLAGLFLATVAAVLLAHSIVDPVRRLSRAAQAFGGGALSTRANFRATGEIEELRTSFNSMAEQIAEREARLKDLDRLKSDFVSGVSHEMRTPLTTVKTLARVLQRGRVREDERDEFLKTIESECDRQIDLVLNLLDLSRIESGSFTISLSPVEVGEVIHSCVKVARHNAESRCQEIRAEVAEELPPVLGDRAVLRRVVCGLIENAIKYTPDGGRITVTAAARASQVQISVSDTGRGIRAEDIPHVFEKFFRGRIPHTLSIAEVGDGVEEVPSVPGVGLGLYLARAIIEEIGGVIHVESTVGRGSTFIICLPSWDHKSIGTNSQN